MRSIVLLAPALLTACATVANAPAQPEAPRGACDAANTERFVGLPGTSETGAAIMHTTHAHELRWAPPGYALTMDYRFDRVTVRLDGGYKITLISCG